MFKNLKFEAPAIEVRDAYLAFRQIVLFKNLNLTLRAGKWTCLLGRSGIGKSTLLRLIAKLPTPDSVVKADISADSGVPLAMQIAYMSQTDMLLPWLTVIENILLFTKLKSFNAAQIKLFTEKAKKYLAETGLADIENYYPDKLSGGMRQRVALIRTVIQDKPVILMDEPFSALDTSTRFHLQNLAAQWLRQRTVFFVTHDPLEALRLADDIYIMSGLPAQFSTPLCLTSPTTRDPASPELIRMQAQLLQELVNAHEVAG